MRRGRALLIRHERRMRVDQGVELADAADGAALLIENDLRAGERRRVGARQLIVPVGRGVLILHLDAPGRPLLPVALEGGRDLGHEVLQVLHRALAQSLWARALIDVALRDHLDVVVAEERAGLVRVVQVAQVDAVGVRDADVDGASEAQDGEFITKILVGTKVFQ